MTRDTDPIMNAALEADAEKLAAMGQDPGPTLEDLGLLGDVRLYSIGLEIKGPAGRFGMLLDADGPLSSVQAQAWAAEVQAEHPDYEVTLLAEGAP